MGQLESAVNRSRGYCNPHVQPPLGHLDLHPARVGAGGRDSDFVVVAVVNHGGMFVLRCSPARQQQVFEQLVDRAFEVAKGSLANDGPNTLSHELILMQPALVGRAPLAQKS